MGDIVNLRLFKKQKARKHKEQLADENRQIHGRTKIEKIFDKRKKMQTDQFLDENRLHPDDTKSDIF